MAHELLTGEQWFNKLETALEEQRLLFSPEQEALARDGGHQGIPAINKVVSIARLVSLGEVSEQ